MSEPPVFPPYVGPPLPPTLRFLNIKHYCMLLSWVFFRPSRLVYFLRQANPSLLYRLGSAVFHSFRYPIYRRLYVMTFGLSVGLCLLTAIFLSLILSHSVPWWTVALGEILALAGGALSILVAGAIFGVGFGAVFGITFSVISSIALPLFGGVWASSNGIVMGVVAIVTAGTVVAGRAYGADGYFIVCTGGIIFAGVAGATQSDIWTGITIMLALLALSIRLPLFLLELVLALLCIGSSKFNRQIWCQHPELWDELLLLPLPGMPAILEKKLGDDLSAGVQSALFVARNPFKRWASQKALSHFIARDKNPLHVLYYLLSCQELSSYIYLPYSKLMRDFIPAARGIILGEMAGLFASGTGDFRNTGERAAWLLTQRLREQERTLLSDFSAVLYSLYRMEFSIEARSHHYTPTNIVGVFRELRESGPNRDTKSSPYNEAELAKRLAFRYGDLKSLRHGPEVAGSFTAMMAFLSLGTVAEIAQAQQHLTWIAEIEDPPLRPSVVNTCVALDDIGQCITVYMQATNLPNKTVALNQAAGGLQELGVYVGNEIWLPERVPLQSLIKHWQSLIAAEQGRLGESALRQMSPSERLATGLVERTSDIWQRPAKPLINPYIAGDPVMPPLFVGRRDIFTKIAEIWRAKANPDSIILYGHRRMGKSSILRNLDQAAPGRVIAYMNLQGETSFVASTADLLLALADRIYAEVKRARPEATLTQPPADQFGTQAAAQIQFNRFMDQVRAALNDTGLILALDEFEAIEEAVRDGKVGKEIYQFLRAKTQEPWITVVFGGLHTLDEMSRDYAQPFYGSYQNIVVSYLAPEDARHLITNPTPDFTVNYELPAVDRIIAATGGQPYLVQLVCRDALDHLNHELFDEHKEREVKITLADVEAALGDDLFRRGTGYFDGVWTQVGEAAQQDLLRCMAQRDTPWTLTELEEATHNKPEELHHHLQLAERRDILRQRDGAWEFCVPLMRQWIVWKEN